MTVSAQPWTAPTAPGPITAEVHLPGSKSLTARALLLAAIAEAPSTLTGVLRSRDTDLMRAALETLGARFTSLDATGTHLAVTPAPRPLRIVPDAAAHHSPHPSPSSSVASVGELPPQVRARIDCGLAGTVMRFIPPLLALADAPVLVDGDPEARHRPLGPLLDALEALGAQVTYLGEHGCLPFILLPVRQPAGGTGSAGAPVPMAIDSSSTSQFLSALLMAATLLPQGAQVTPSGPVPSLPHVAMTVEALRQAGCQVDEPKAHALEGARSWTVRPGAPRGCDAAIEPDLSNAGPFLAAALVTGGSVSVPHWPAATTQAGDAWRWLLPALGGTVTTTEGNDGSVTLAAHGTGRLSGIEADLGEVGELTPTVAALATLASQQGHASRLTGVGHLRGHETDRLHALVTEVRRLGGIAHELDDGIAIDALPAGQHLHAARLETYADHRMATFAAVIGLAVPGTTLSDVSCTSKTLPDFPTLWADMLGSVSERAEA